MRDDIDNAVDNQLADAEQGNRQQSAEKPDENSTSDNRPPGLPHDLQHRRNLPERRQVLPIVASSADGAEQRTIVLAVERNTKVMEPVLRETSD